MSDSDSDFEILAVSNSDGVIINDKELLNAEFKKPKISTSTTPITATVQDDVPISLTDTIDVNSDEHFMDVEEEVKEIPKNNQNKAIQDTIIIDSQSQDSPANTSNNGNVSGDNLDIPKLNANDAAMNQILTQLADIRNKGILAINNSSTIQLARSHFENSIIATRKLNLTFKDIQNKLQNVLTVFKNKISRKSLENDNIAVNQLFKRQSDLMKVIHDNEESFRTKCSQNTKDLIQVHENVVKKLGTFFNKEQEASPPPVQKTKVDANKKREIQMNVAKVKNVIMSLYDGRERVSPDDNFFGTDATKAIKGLMDLPPFKNATTPAQKERLAQALSLKASGYSVDLFLKKQDQWVKIQEQNKLDKLERNTGNNANDIEREYLLAVKEYESNDDTLGLGRVAKRENPFLPDAILKNIEAKSFNKQGMRYTIEDLKYRYSGWLDDKFDATILVGNPIHVPRCLVIDDPEKYPINALDVNQFIVDMSNGLYALTPDNVKTCYKGYKVVADLLIRCSYALNVLKQHMDERMNLYNSDSMLMEKNSSFNPRTKSFGSAQLQSRYSKLLTLREHFRVGIAVVDKIKMSLVVVEKYFKHLGFTALPSLKHVEKMVHHERIMEIKKTLLETGNSEFQKEIKDRFHISDLKSTKQNDGIHGGKLISATDIDDFKALVKGMTKRNETSEVDTPPEMNCQLMKHQKIGLHRLLELERSRSLGGLLSDEMGLGKTIQMIALMVANRQTVTGEGDVYSKEKYPILIVAPVSLLHNWKFEIQSKIKSEYQFSITTFHENNKPATFAELQKFDVVLTSYTTLGYEYKKHLPGNYDKATNSFKDSTGEMRKFPALPTINFMNSLKRPNEYESPFYQENSMFYRIILDESHEIKNLETGKFKSCSLLRAKYRWCLSGTPIQNNVYDIFAVIKFLRIRPFMKDTIFNEKIGRHLDLKKNKKDSDSASKREAERLLQGLISTISIRRTKDTKIDGQPLLTLPELNDHKVISVMDEDERLIYEQLEANLAAEAQLLIRHANTPEAKQRPIFTLLLRLRQACIHFILVKIGELKSEMRKLTDSNYTKAWKHYVDDVKEQLSHVTAEVNKFVELEGPCAMCNEVPGRNTTHLFQAKYVPGCGHTICGRCIETVDEEYRLVDPTAADLVFKCPKCTNQVIEEELIPTALFDSIVNKGFDNHHDLTKAYKGFVEHVVALKTEEANIDYSTLPTTAKIKQTIDLINQIKAEDPTAKILIFCSFTTFFTLLSFFIDKELKMPYVNFDGTMNVHKKSEAIETFRNDPDCSLMLISLKAGNVGLTLTMANHVILVDPYWNPSVEDQAIGRAHRISQNKPVKVHRLLVENTVEDRILNIQERKKELAGAIIDAQKMKEASALGTRELGYLFGLNALNDSRVDNTTRHVANEEAEFYE